MATNKTLKVVVRADLTAAALTELYKDIDDLAKKVNKKIEVKAHIKDIVIDQSALSSVKGQIQKIFNTVTVDIDGNILGVGTGKATGISSLEKYAQTLQARLQSIFNPRLFSEGTSIEKQFQSLTASIKGAKTKEELDKISDSIFEFRNTITGVYQPLSKLQTQLNSFGSKKYLNLDSEQLKQLSALKNDIGKAFNSDTTSVKDVEQLQSRVSALIDSMSKGNPTATNFANRMEQVYASLDRINSALASRRGLTMSDDIGRITNTLQGLYNIGGGTTATIREFVNNTQQLAQINTDGIREAFASLDLLGANERTGGALSAELVNVINILGKFESQINQVSDSMRRNNAMETYEKRLSSLSNELNTFVGKYSKIGQNESAVAQYQKLKKNIEDLDKNPNDAGLTILSKDIKNFEKAAKDAGLTTDTLGEKIQKAYQKFGGWAIITSTMMKAVQYIKEMYQNVILLDTAMTELKKVTDETQAGYDAFMNRAKNTAKEIGASLSDVITATADFSRLGYSMSDAEELSKAALVYKQVGDGINDVTKASETLITTMKAFEDQVGNAGSAMSIVDKLNEVSNTQAVSAQGLGESLARSASAMAAAGNTLDETIALAAAMNTVLQNPEQTGTTMKTMSMYLRAAKVDAEEAGIATDGMASSVSKLRSSILTLTKGTSKQVDIMLNPTTFKSTYQIIKGIAAVYDEMSDVDQSALLELIGGKRNANAMAAVIQQFKIAEKTLETSLNSTGSATRENEKYLESIQGKLTQLKAAFESLSATVMNSDVIKFGIDRVTDLVNALDWMTQTFTPLPGLITAAGAALNSFGIKWFDLASTGSNGGIENNGIFHLFDDKLFKNKAQEAAKAIQTVSETTYDLDENMQAVNVSTNDFGAAVKDMASGLQASNKGMDLLRLKTIALNMALNLAVSAAAALIIYLGKQAYDAIVVTAEEMQKCADAAEDMSKSLAEGDDYISRIQKLSATLKDTSVSQTELNSAKADLLSIQDALVEKYGDEAKALDLVNGKQEEAIELIKQKQKEEFNAWRNKNQNTISYANNMYYDYNPETRYGTMGSGRRGTTRYVRGANSKELESLLSQIQGASEYKDYFYFDNDSFGMVTKNADEAYVALNNLMTIIEESGNVEKYSNAFGWLGYQLERAGQYSEKYGDVAKRITEETAKFDSRFSSYYDTLTEKIKNLKDLLGSGSSEDISQEISNAYVEAMNAMDLAVGSTRSSTNPYAEQIADYFRNMYPDLEKEFEQYQFDIRLKTDDSDLQKQFTEITKQLNDMGLDDPIEIKAAINSKELSEPFQQLESVAQEYGFTVDELIDKLEQFGYVQSANLSGDLFGDSAAEIQQIASRYENSISILERLRKEQDAFGKVSAKSYAELIELGDDYKNIVTSQVDATGELIYVYDSDTAEKFAQQQLNLAIQSLYAADATESEMEAFREMYQSVSTLGSQMQKYVSSAKAITSLQKEIAKDTEYTYEEVLKLSETYPELSYTYDELSGKYKIEQSSVAGLTKRYDELIKKIIELRQELAQGFSFDAIRAAGYQNADDAQVRGLYKMVEQQIKEHNITSVEEYRKLTNSELKPWVVATIEAILSAQTDTLNYLSDNIQWGEETKSSSGSSTDAWKEQFDNWYSEKNHALEMGRISEEQYVSELEVMYKKYFSNLSKYQDDYFKYEKEVYQKRQELVNDYISKVEEQVKKSGDESHMVEELNKLLKEKNSILSKEQKSTINEKIVEYTVKGYEDSIDLLEDQLALVEDKNDTEEEAIGIYKEILSYVEQIQEYYRSIGYDDASDQLLELSRRYQDYVNKIDSINEKLYEKQKEAQIKALEEENDYIDDAMNAMDDILDATVDLIKRETNAQIDALEDQKNQIEDYYDNLKDSTEEYYDSMKDKAKDSYDSQKEEMNAYYDDLIDKIKDSSDAQKQALKDELDAYKKIINAQKEKLQNMRDEENYNSNVAEKNKNIASLQSQIDALALDDSRSAQAKRLKLEEELAKAKKDLADYQADYSLDKQLDALDKEYDAFEENINNQIDAIEKSVDKETKIYQKKQKEMLKLLESQHNAELESIESRRKAALARIESEREAAVASLDSQIQSLQDYLSKEGVLWQDANERIRTQGKALWSELRSYAAEYTRDVEGLEDAWNKALSAVDRYNGGSMDFSSTKDAMSNKKNYNSSEKDRLANETYTGGAGKNKDEDQLINAAKSQMQANSKAWHNATSQYQKDLYAQMNQEIAESLNRTLGRRALTYNAAKGVWYLDGVRFYHKGGIIGGGTLKQNEELAVLQKGEAVLTQKSQESLSKFMEVVKNLSNSMISWKGNDPIQKISKGLIRRGTVYGHDVEPIVVEKLFDFHADNVTSETMPQLEKLLKKASDYTVEQLEDRLSRRGVKTKIKGNSI